MIIYPLKKANGKLLLTSEYFVLDGADAIALPTQLGQSLEVFAIPKTSFFIHWQSFDSNQIEWLNVQFSLEMTSLSTKDEEIKLQSILNECMLLNPKMLDSGHSYIFKTYLEFDRTWGLGTSSTLISLLADFFKINPYELLENTFGGSGYDLACANVNSPFVYNNIEKYNPKIFKFQFDFNFKNSLYFVYTGKKQNSRDGIGHYKSLKIDKTKVIKALNDLNQKILHASNLLEFELAINEHESIIAEYIQLPKLKDTLFSDFWGSAKSLGAWGGDFALLTNNRSENELLDYLEQKNIDTIFKFEDLINWK